MMGHRQVEQAALLYEFSLEKHVPVEHLLRSIDRFVELGELRRELAQPTVKVGCMRCTKMLRRMSGPGHQRRFSDARLTSALARTTEVSATTSCRRFVTQYATSSCL